MDHIGIDVHKKESQICILTEDGELLERRLRTEPGRFADALGGRPPARILIEAATESEWVARCLEALGHEVIVADPNFAPMYAQRRRTVKTDRRDARALAEACLLGAFRRAHRLSDAQRNVRARLTVREALVRTRTGYISIIRSLLRQHGWRVRSGAPESLSHRVRALPLPGRLLSEIAPLLAVLRHVNAQIAYCDARIETLTATDTRVRGLRTVPNVGPVTAAAFVATLDEATRFRRSHEVEASSAWSRANGARAKPSTEDASRRPGPRACAASWSKPPSRRSGAQTRGWRPCESGRCGSPAAAARKSPSWHWPAAWPVFSTRCCAMAASTTRAPFRPPAATRRCLR